MDVYNSGNPIGLGPRQRQRKPKRRYMAKFFTLIALVLLAIGGYVIYQYLTSNQQAAVKPVQMLSEVPVSNLDKARVEKWNGVTKKVAYLTFEDGPTALTSDILSELQQQDIKATFFLIGPNIKQQPDVVRKMADEGHYIGLHSQSHDYDTLYKKKQYVPEMLKVQQQIQQLTNRSPVLTRPPYGSSPGITKTMAKDIERAKLRVWDWSIDSMDWYYKDSAKQVAKTVIDRAEDPVEIILLHEQPQSLRAIPAIVAGLKKKGYQFSIYDEDFHIPYHFAKFPNL